MNRKLLIAIATVIFLILGTYTAIQFAKGYRPNFDAKEIQGTGLLVVNSVPEGAQVLINGKLTTATDDTINLPPGEYTVEIKKDGYISWQKSVHVEAELVTQANARLFPAVTDVDPLTFTGAMNLTPSPDGQKVIYAVEESSIDTKKGLWILDLVCRPISLSKDPRQIVQNTGGLNFTQALLSWSPDSNQVLAHFPPDSNQSSLFEQNLILDSTKFSSQESLRDATAQLPVIFSQWEEQIARKLNDQLSDLPPQVQEIATASATNLYFSPDEEKLLYTATQDAVIPDDLIASLPSSSTQPEHREIKSGNVYVYDIKEDKNFLILESAKPAELGEQVTREMIIDRITPRTFFSQESSPSAFTKLQKETTEETINAFQAQYSPRKQPVMWFPDSNHLIINDEEKITIIEYDGTNADTVYSGTLEEGFVYPWPDGSKLLILTSLNSESTLSPNIYAIILK